MRLETVFHDAIKASGIADACSNYILMDRDAPIKASAILPTLILQCAVDWPNEHRPMLWELQFETIIFGPLAALNHTYGKECGALDAMAAFVAALETPIVEHEALLATIPVTLQTQPIVQLACGELKSRRNTINALRSDATITQEGDALDVAVYSRDFQIAGMRLSEDRNRRRAGERLGGYGSAQIRPQKSSGILPPDDVESILDAARRVLATWDDLPDC